MKITKGLRFPRYDADRGMVTSNGAGKRSSSAWPWVYLVLAALEFVIVGLWWIGVPVLSRLSELSIAVLVVGLFAVASVLYWYDVSQ